MIPSSLKILNRAGLAVLNDKVYAVGGFNGSLRVRTVDVYDPSTDTWSTSCNMEARRSTLGTIYTIFFYSKSNKNYVAKMNILL